MNKVIAAALVVAVAGIAGGAYWLGARNADAGHAKQMSAMADGSGKAAKKLLYYRNPMGEPDTSPVPKKDQMGMDYIPVYEGEDDSEAAPGTVKISAAKIQKLGVRTEPVVMREVDRVVRAVARVDASERHVVGISPKFDGWIEKVYVNTIYQLVKKGDPLIDVYGPDLLAAQKEYVIAAEGIDRMKDADPQAQESVKRLAESALARLRNWDVSEQQIQHLQKTREVRHTLTVTARAAGFVTDKKMVFPGMSFKAGTEIYLLADLLSSVWIMADVFEQDMALLKIGQQATVSFNAHPGKEYRAHINYIYPILNATTRTTTVRLEIENNDMKTLGAMYADVVFDVGKGRGKVATVPRSAVLSSGTRQAVLVQSGEGRFEPREVKTGVEGDRYVEIVKGVKAGETVVTAANFMIDSESNLSAAFSILGTQPGETGVKPGGDTPSMQGSMSKMSAAPPGAKDAPLMKEPVQKTASNNDSASAGRAGN
jgi:RND family efflux transporter MFP subunit